MRSFAEHHLTCATTRIARKAQIAAPVGVRPRCGQLEKDNERFVRLKGKPGARSVELQPSPKMTVGQQSVHS
jgi:hypothetical protein